MRKINFYSIIALVGAMVLSMSSCTKDLEDDVDALKKEVAANKDAIKSLQDAINNGSLITKVEPVTGGFKITFSGNVDPITVTNGIPGDAGSDGIQGETGFAPVLGIDAEGFWTVVKTLGGTAEKILGADGLPVKAKGTDGSDAVVSVTKDGFLKIGETVTTIGNTSSVILNKVNGTALISMWNSETKEMEQFTVPLVGEGGVVASLRTPLSAGFALTLVQGTAAATLVDGPFAGEITKDDVLISGVLPVIVNPSNAAMLPANFSLENAKGEAFDVKFTKAVKGYDGKLASTKAATDVNGITALTVSSNKKTIIAATNLALKYATAGENAVYSTYDYNVTIDAPTDLTTTADASSVKKIGTPITFNGETAKGALYQIAPANIYKQKIALHSESAKYASYFDFGADGNTVTSKTDAASVSALSGAAVKFVYSILDYNGACKGYTAGKYTEASALVVTVVFYDSKFQSEYSLLPITHALSSTAKTSTVELSTLFTSLGTDGAAYWKANANTFSYKYFVKDEKGEWAVTTDIKDARLLKVDGKTATTVAAEAAKLEVTIDEAKALPTNTYKVEMSYVDGSTPTGKETFTINTEVKVTNPTTILDRKTAIFEGNKLDIYGDTQDTPGTNSYLLTNAYNNVTGVVIGFEEIDEKGGLTAIKDSKVMMPTSSINNPINVKVTGTLFGNAKNIVAENIVVTPRSSIATGNLTINKGAKLELIYDQTLTGDKAKVDLSKVLTMVDAETKSVVFLGDPLDTRLKTVTCVAEGSNKDLIKITETSGEQTVTIVYTSQSIPAAVTITIKITLTDQYDQVITKTIDFEIKPKATV